MGNSNESTRTLTCIGCPLGCQITVSMQGEEIVSVTGNTCPRGDKYARSEVTNPVRTVTSIVRVDNGEIAMVSVKTASDIPKAMIFDIMKEIDSARVNAPVKIGDVIIPNICNSGVDLIATKNVAAK